MTTVFNTMVFLDKNAEVCIDFDLKAKLFWYRNFPYFALQNVLFSETIQHSAFIAAVLFQRLRVLY